MIPAASLADFSAESTPIYGQAIDAVTVNLLLDELLMEDDAETLMAGLIKETRRLRPVTDGCAECFDAGFICTPDDGCVTRCPRGICDECDEAAER